MAITSLGRCEPGDVRWVVELQGGDQLRRRLVEMGFLPGTGVEVVATAPLGDPLELELRGYRIAVRRSEAERIRVSDEAPPGSSPTDREPTGAPTDREPTGAPAEQEPAPQPAMPARARRTWGGLFRRSRRTDGDCCHSSGDGGGGGTCCHGGAPEAVLERDDATVVVALAGNPNTGKSSLFNALTGGRQHVGNWPGKTVTCVEGYRQVADVQLRIVDLPGMYSLRSASPEELAAEEFLTSGVPDVLVVVVDSTNLERNLFLVLELAELNIPLLVAANMTDLARRQGRPLNCTALSDALGVPVVATIGRVGRGIDDLVTAMVAQAGTRKKAVR